MRGSRIFSQGEGGGGRGISMLPLGGSEAYFREFYYVNIKFKFYRGPDPSPFPHNPLDPRMIFLRVVTCYMCKNVSYKIQLYFL